MAEIEQSNEPHDERRLTPLEARKRRLYPYSVDDIQALALDAAGVSRDELASATREAFDTARESLKAEKHVVLSFEGQHTETVTVPDHATRLKAADQVLEITHVKPSKQVYGQIEHKHSFRRPSWLPSPGAVLDTPSALVVENPLPDQAVTPGPVAECDGNVTGAAEAPPP